MRLRRFRLPLLGFAVILVVCAGTVLAAIYNRVGIPESTLRLSERELELPAVDESGKQENTPLTLHLVWRVESADQVDSGAMAASATRAAWITQSKLAQLGIALPGRARPDTFVSTLLVLELDGPAHARAVTRACDPASPLRDERNCEFEAKKSSRLYVVDAGSSVAELRRRYPDRTHFAIVSGVIKLSQDLNSGEVAGYVSGLSGDTVQGMEPLRSTVDSATGEMLWHRLLARHFFDAVISFGRRLEPWNVSIEARASEAAGPAA
jgi:hypothetical protein